MNVAIVVAAGKGTRLGGKQPKQFLKLDGIPVIIHTLKRFEKCKDIDEVIVVLPRKELKKFPALLQQYGLRKVRRCVAGGETRADSVRLGYQALSENGVKIVAIHDGVRPFVAPSEISETVLSAIKHGAAILAIPVSDTIKVVRNGHVLFTPPRKDFWRALTPQCFSYSDLRRAFTGPLWRQQSWKQQLTDDSELVEKVIRPKRVALVEGNSRNIKITQPEDIAVAEIILRKNRGFRIKN